VRANEYTICTDLVPNDIRVLWIVFITVSSSGRSSSIVLKLIRLVLHELEYFHVTRVSKSVSKPLDCFVYSASQTIRPILL
jgi:hypothetical protein